MNVLTSAPEVATIAPPRAKERRQFETSMPVGPAAIGSMAMARSAVQAGLAHHEDQDAPRIIAQANASSRFAGRRAPKNGPGKKEVIAAHIAAPIHLLETLENEEQAKVHNTTSLPGVLVGCASNERQQKAIDQPVGGEGHRTLAASRAAD
jgi:hypothetical protein